MKNSFLNKKTFISIIILFILFLGGFFLFQNGFSNFKLLSASVGSLFKNDEIQSLKSSLAKMELEMKAIQEENELLRKNLSETEEKMANLESKYESELVNLSQAIDTLTQTINTFKKVAVLGTSTEESTTTDEKTEICQINLNTASLQELQKLIGIGPTLAQRIIDNRPFASVYELTKVSGIGEVTLQKIIAQGCAYVENDIGPVVVQPTSSGGSGAPPQSSSSKTTNTCQPNSIEINTAPQSELEKLTGVGPSTAQKIIEGRFYYSLDDLLRVSGIGVSTLEKIKNQGCAYVNQNLLPPIALFAFSPENPLVGEEVLLDASSSTSPVGQIVSYFWDFGDGNTTTTNLATATHSFATNGQFLVSLIVINENNLTSLPATTTINIQEEPPKLVNLLLNPSFEEEGTTSSEANYWTIKTTKTNRSNENKKNGEWSMKMSELTTSYDGREFLSDLIEVIPEKEYSFGVWYYLISQTSTTADNYRYFIQIRWLDENRNLISERPGQGIDFAVFDEWTKVEFSEIAPTNTVYAQLRVRAQRNNTNIAKTDVYWDDTFLIGPAK